MSSSLRPRTWSLRTRLVAGQLVLLTCVCAVIGVVSGFALRDFQLDKLDEQLYGTADRVVRTLGPPGPGRRPDGPLEGPGFGVGTIVIIKGTGDVLQGTLVDSSGQPVALTGDRATPVESVAAGAPPRTVSLEDGDFRVVAVALPGGQTVYTGLPTDAVDSTVLRLGLILGGVSLAGLLAAGLAGTFVVRRALRPLDRVADTATRVAGLPLHQGEVALAERVPEEDTNPDTEVGKVGLALNRLLGHVGGALESRHASETRVRQFVADASHELRTPLAAIRGYAELTRRTKEAVPPEIGHAMRRVESEAVRMTSLVEDLLLLARLDAGRPLGHDPVDLSRIVVDSVSDARIAGPEHEWRLQVPSEALTVTGDEHKLRQVLANLLSNARAHTPPGTTVVTRLSAVGEHVEVAVTDDGPGIPYDLQPEIFERFTRGDTSRSRAAGSTGLGLSIVAAVVAAHGGAVRVDSRPGRTTFTARLPR
ncbi:sensor histidine kinase [Saccharothrix longispora]|uniref:histidine kinase n=1 Tax=Saccharothrix longispora TaxID=33920 RepID=A0ABU1PN02_9PSEU|nr:ATP-binding protein [Saccharothrix longispora]MDR6592040.1 two-component system OmpR family sensor kinase [Saccharothrix longispora]